MCLRRAPEKYITGAALDRADLAKRAFYSFPFLLLNTYYLIVPCHFEDYVP
jgi:hypothetical protein